MEADAEWIEAKIEDVNRLMALVTANHEKAQNILQWDNMREIQSDAHCYGITIQT